MKGGCSKPRVRTRGPRFPRPVIDLAEILKFAAFARLSLCGFVPQGFRKVSFSNKIGELYFHGSSDLHDTGTLLNLDQRASLSRSSFLEAAETVKNGSSQNHGLLYRDFAHRSTLNASPILCTTGPKDQSGSQL